MLVEEIILGCKRKDEKCQREMVFKYSSLLFTVCRRYARDQSDAEDILQDGFIEIFDSIKSYDMLKGGLEQWMKKIVARVAIHKYRKMYMIKETYDSDISEIENNESDILDKIEVEEILNQISKLPEKYKEVLNLYIFEDFSHKEIGELLGIEESSSRSRLTRGKKMLIENLNITDKDIKIMNF